MSDKKKKTQNAESTFGSQKRTGPGSFLSSWNPHKPSNPTHLQLYWQPTQTAGKNINEENNISLQEPILVKVFQRSASKAENHCICKLSGGPLTHTHAYTCTHTHTFSHLVIAETAVFSPSTHLGQHVSFPPPFPTSFPSSLSNTAKNTKLHC